MVNNINKNNILYFILILVILICMFLLIIYHKKDNKYININREKELDILINHEEVVDTTTKTKRINIFKGVKAYVIIDGVKYNMGDEYCIGKNSSIDFYFKGLSEKYNLYYKFNNSSYIRMKSNNIFSDLNNNSFLNIKVVTKSTTKIYDVGVFKLCI